MTGFLAKIKKLFRVLGPGLITGASDDDPSGIATYSQTGAKFGLSTLWTALITFPLMASMQEMCARIGLVTSIGLTSIIRDNYSRLLLYFMMILSLPAIILNIGADISGMGAVANLIVPSIKPIFFSISFTIILLILIVYLPYHKIVSILKYLCLSLFLYIAVPFFTHPSWEKVLRSTLLPTIKWNKEFLSIIVAILGTTISPYLFFWQVTMEAEDVKAQKRLVLARRKLYRENSDGEKPYRREKNFIKLLIQKMQLDVNIGMLLSNVVMYFIILATGTALSGTGLKQIDTVEQAAKALEPVAGKASYFLFALGVIGTGFIAIPVLSGSFSYIVSETFGWKGTLDKKYSQAKSFYIVIGISLAAGLMLNYVGVSPIQALIYTAILYGLTSPILIAIVLHIGNNKKIMGDYTNRALSNILGIITMIVMTAAAGALIYFQFS
ncbi:iron transporter [Niastella vici]|uniref:Iron transporter n=1 Tax=Niastella vici TaxID=1703345 RepID=A0A1V9FKP6_9BACT|nr:divalent metal cation transporter [Niastella vici]OQP58949.1 iron transporter [Niastella vici]